MNIVVIVIDTLRYDYVGAHGNDWIRTPNMDRLAAESWVFENCYTASFPTIPHRTDAFTGRHGGPFHAWYPLPFDLPTLPGVLRQMGYATQLIHDTPHLVNGGHNFDWPFHAWTFIRGAEVDRPYLTDEIDWPDNWAADPIFDDVADDVIENPRMVATYARANRNRKAYEDWNCAKLFLRACRFLADNAKRENFFLWLDCFDPHEPWDAPPEFVKMYDQTPTYDGRIDPRSFICRNSPKLSKAGQKRIAAAYAAKVSWVDRWLGEFLDALERTGLGKNTAVILTSDHGTNDGSRPTGESRARFGKGHQPIHEDLAHAPLMIYVPDGGSGRCEAIVQPQDLFATVMGLAGGKAPGELDSHDVLAVARQQRQSPRKLAVAGQPPHLWDRGEGACLFTAFDGQWCLEVAAKAEQCRLMKKGSQKDVAAKHADVVAGLHTEAMDEIDRRGTDPLVMHWLRSGGKDDFPPKARYCDRYPGPPGYTQYFVRLYRDE